MIILLISSCSIQKVPVSSLQREVKASNNIIVGWEYYVELTNGNLKSESIYNSNITQNENDALDKAIDAIHYFASHDSLIKKQVLKPILKYKENTVSTVSSFSLIKKQIKDRYQND